MVVSLTEEDRVRGGSGPKRAKLRCHQTLKWRWLLEMDKVWSGSRRMERGESGLEERKHVKRDPELIVSFCTRASGHWAGVTEPRAQGRPRHQDTILVTQQPVSLTQELGSDCALARTRMRMEWDDMNAIWRSIPRGCGHTSL